jgi:hypothetical protein
MKKDIEFTPVQGVLITIARRVNELNQSEWQVYLINRNPHALTNVFVTSRGYSEKSEDQQRTSTMRHFFAEVLPGQVVVVEPIMPEVFPLNNEFWVSYFVDNKVFDKKFIFVPDSIIEAHLVKIPELGTEGILHE